ncbi:MAG: hypothetical protein WC350_04885 [Candidatus Micrarchaeia archaeon]|jgi:hypothetical protein
MVELTFNLDIPVILAALSAIFLYLGKCVSDVKIEKYDKEGYYFEGLFFFAVYVFVPLVIADYAKNFWAVSVIFQVLPFYVFPFILQAVILGALTSNFRANAFIRRTGLVEYYKIKLAEGIQKIKKDNSRMGKLVKDAEKDFKDLAGFDYSELSFKANYVWPIEIFGNNFLLFLFAFITILIEFKFYEIGGLVFYVSTFLTFFIMTFIALAFGFGGAHYPVVRLFLDSGEVLSGRVIKYGDYVEMIQDAKKFSVNSSKIIKIESKLFKE